ncbi:unnamed protein product [Adineta steineri]|uniref:Uncharacterized protein n=1 Tax=Adineta steineri TaxID=433720 RepID=A0A819JLJ0_9BILA|nr:unnamed protein product [Adineta steineri]
MTNYRCEEPCLCTNFQSAICLHCNRRLCFQHITDHNQILSVNIQKLSNELNITYQHLKEDTEKNRAIYHDTLTSLTQWRTEQFTKIEQNYQQQLQLITLQQQDIQDSYKTLFNKLEVDAREPLRLLESQPNSIISILNLVENTMKDVEKDLEKIHYTFPKLPIMTLRQDEYQPTISLTHQPTKKRKITSSVSLPITTVNLNFCRPLRRLVEMFKFISPVEESKNQINIYIRNQRGSFEFSNLVCSYLTAWHRHQNINTKVAFLNAHLSTVQQYFLRQKTDFDIIVAIQGFFYDALMNESKYAFQSIFKKNINNHIPATEMMTFLLQFFLNHQLLNPTTILTWYNDKTMISYEGFEFVKDLAAPFIKSISVQRTGKFKYQYYVYQLFILVDNTPPITSVIRPTEHNPNILIKDEALSPNGR